MYASCSESLVFTSDPDVPFLIKEAWRSRRLHISVLIAFILLWSIPTIMRLRTAEYWSIENVCKAVLPRGAHCMSQVCEKSKWYCALHLQLAREASKQCRRRKALARKAAPKKRQRAERVTSSGYYLRAQQLVVPFPSYRGLRCRPKRNTFFHH